MGRAHGETRIAGGERGAASREWLLCYGLNPINHSNYDSLIAATAPRGDKAGHPRDGADPLRARMRVETAYVDELGLLHAGCKSLECAAVVVGVLQSKGLKY